MSSHEPLLDCPESVDAAPYVLGALEDGEAFRAHLDGCATCRAEVAELQRVADMLPASAPPAVASQALRARVLAQVRSEARLLQAAGDHAEQPRRSSRSSRWWRSRRAPFLTGAVALATGAAVAAAIAISLGTSTPERVTRAQVASVARGAQAFLRQRDGRADLVVSGMPQPPLGRIYEVWLQRASGSPQPTDALFSVTSRGSGAVDVPYSLHGVKEVMVTSEPLGGSSEPTRAPVLRVVLAA